MVMSMVMSGKFIFCMSSDLLWLINQHAPFPLLEPLQLQFLCCTCITCDIIIPTETDASQSSFIHIYIHVYSPAGALVVITKSAGHNSLCSCTVHALLFQKKHSLYNT